MAVKKSNEISKIIESLEKHYGSIKPTKKQPTLMELLVYHIMEVGERQENTKKAFAALLNEFVDWNEVRVTQPKEIQEIIEKYIKKEAYRKSHLLRDTLTSIFAYCNTMNLQFLLDLDFIDIQKFFSEIGITDDKFLLKVLSQTNHKEDLSICQNFIRVGKRVGLWEESTTVAAIKKVAQKNFSKNFLQLHTLFFLHGERVCLPSSYDCANCSILQQCNWGNKKQEKITKTNVAKQTQRRKKKQEEPKKKEPQTRRRSKK